MLGTCWRLGRFSRHVIVVMKTVLWRVVFSEGLKNVISGKAALSSGKRMADTSLQASFRYKRAAEDAPIFFTHFRTVKGHVHAYPHTYRPYRVRHKKVIPWRFLLISTTNCNFNKENLWDNFTLIFMYNAKLRYQNI